MLLFFGILEIDGRITSICYSKLLMSIEKTIMVQTSWLTWD